MKRFVLLVHALLCVLYLECKEQQHGSQSFCKAVCYYEVQKAVKNHTTIIDVRPKQEVAETGLIPSSVNIPLTCLRANLEMSRGEFKDEYGCPKPRKRDLIIVTGRAGTPNADACEVLCFLGYKKVRDYTGGYEEYDVKSKACRPSRPRPPCDEPDDGQPCGETTPTCEARAKAGACGGECPDA